MFRKSGKKYDVIEFQRYNYIPAEIEKVSLLIKENLTDELLSNDIKKKYPPNHKRWQYPYFGYCVPATFSMLYLMNTNLLEPISGEDSLGENHWWLRDIISKKKYDLTLEQFATEKELQDVYDTGKPKAYYGFGENPAKRFFNLIQKVQPKSKRWTTYDYRENPATLSPYL